MSGRCWYCDQPIVPPVEIVGRWLAGTSQLVHKRCLQVLGELDLDLRWGEAGPELDGRQVPGRPRRRP